MKIPKKPMASLEVDLVDEEAYELHQPDDFNPCLVIEIRFVDNDFIKIPVNESEESLESVRIILTEYFNEKLQIYDQSSSNKLIFNYNLDGFLREILPENESIPIKQLIETLSLEKIVENQSLKLFILNSSDFNIEFPDIEDKIFWFYAKVTYNNHLSQQKIITGRIKPKPQILLISTQGIIEDHMKLGSLKLAPEDESSILFKFSINDSKNAEKKFSLSIQLESPSVRDSVLNFCNEILEAYNKKDEPSNSPTALNKVFFIKKVNRYGIGQKREIWFNNDESTLNITPPKKKNIKTFKIDSIESCIPTRKEEKIILKFYNSKAKKLSLVFKDKRDLGDFRTIFENLTKINFGTREMRNTTSLITDHFDSIPSFRRFTWLDKSITTDIFNKSNNNEYFYNVIQKGRVSHQKLVLELNMNTSEIIIKNQLDETVKVLLLNQIGVQDNYKNSSKILLYYINIRFLFIFNSNYAKYHFLTNFYSTKYREKIFPTENIITQQLPVYVGTWNLALSVRPSPEVLKTLLSNTINNKIISLGFQQCSKNSIDAWMHELSQFYNAYDYTLVSFSALYDTFIVVFILKSLKKWVSNIKSSTKAFSSTPKNRKGAVITSFSIEATSFCFVSCHLVSGAGTVLERNENCKEILDTKGHTKDIEMSHEFDYVFFSGDLNYTINAEEALKANSLNAKNFSELIKYDQLLIQISLGNVLAGFKEGPLEFSPTYPANPLDDSISDFNKAGWNDRVLYKANKNITLVRYGLTAESCRSNHKPVSAEVIVDVTSWYVPQVLHSLNTKFNLGAVRIKNLSFINSLDDSSSAVYEISVYSKYLEKTPEPVLSTVINSGESEFNFDFQKSNTINFIFTNTSFLKDQRIVFTIKKRVDSDIFILTGVSSVSLKEIVEEFETRSSGLIKKIKTLEIPVERHSSVIGKLVGIWKFKIIDAII